MVDPTQINNSYLISQWIIAVGTIFVVILAIWGEQLRAYILRVGGVNDSLRLNQILLAQLQRHCRLLA
jgi:hypothetical protein